MSNSSKVVEASTEKPVSLKDGWALREVSFEIIYPRTEKDPHFPPNKQDKQIPISRDQIYICILHLYTCPGLGAATTSIGCRRRGEGALKSSTPCNFLGCTIHQSFDSIPCWVIAVAHQNFRLMISEQLPEKEIERRRWYLGVGYMMAMGICGVVLTAIGSTLDAIAKNCGTTSTDIGTVFVARGCGAILGAISSAKLYQAPNNGNSVMSVTLGILVILMMHIPFITNLVVLHMVFFGLGFCTAVTDTGCQVCN